MGELRSAMLDNCAKLRSNITPKRGCECQFNSRRNKKSACKQ
jgi:hypothetical protein